VKQLLARARWDVLIGLVAAVGYAQHPTGYVPPQSDPPEHRRPQLASASRTPSSIVPQCFPF
jgi:hypothetical protein